MTKSRKRLQKILAVFWLVSLAGVAAIAAEPPQPTLAANAAAPLQPSVHLNESRGYVGLRGGFIELEDVDDQGSFNMGLFGAYQMFPALALEFSLDFQISEIYIGDEYDGAYVEFIDRKTTAFQCGVNFSPVQRGPFRPFLTGGFGYFYSKYTDDHYYDDYWKGDYWDDHVGEGGFYAGAGADLFGRSDTARGFTFTTEAHWLFTEEEHQRDEVRSDGFIVTAGVKFRF